MALSPISYEQCKQMRAALERPVTDDVVPRSGNSIGRHPYPQKPQHLTEYFKMKKALLIAFIAMTFVGSGCNTASAAGGRYGRPSVSQRGQMGPIARLIELERRKNAALRRMFFGS